MNQLNDELKKIEKGGIEAKKVKKILSQNLTALYSEKKKAFEKYVSDNRESSKKKVKFADVIGLENEKKMILSKDKKLKTIFAFGPPGSGRTYFSKAIAGETDVNFFSVNTKKLCEKTDEKTLELFRAALVLAREHKPCVLFLAEVETLLSGNTNRSKMFREKLKRHMTESVYDNAGITFVAGVKEPWKIRKSVLDLFSTKWYFCLPDDSQRREYFSRLKIKYPTDFTKSDLARFSLQTEGYSFTDLQSLSKKIEDRHEEMGAESVYYLPTGKELNGKKMYVPSPSGGKEGCLYINGKKKWDMIFQGEVYVTGDVVDYAIAHMTKIKNIKDEEIKKYEEFAKNITMAETARNDL